MMYGLDGGSCKYCGPPPIQNIRFGPAALRRPEAEKRVSFLIIYVSLYICPQRQKEALHPRPAGDGTDAAREAAETVPRGIGTRSAARWPCAGRVTDLEKMRDKAGQVLYKMKK